MAAAKHARSVPAEGEAKEEGLAEAVNELSDGGSDGGVC